MEWHKVQKNWNKVKGQFQQKFSKISEEDMKHIGGDRKKMQKYIQKQYGLGTKEAERRLERFVEDLEIPEVQ